MKRLLLILFGVLFFTNSFAQGYTLKGNVVSIDGEALAGVNIIIQGTTTGTITNGEGNYSINVRPGNKLQFSFIGFKKYEVIIKDQKQLNIQMAVDQTTNVEEVVVVGYGQAKRLSVTGAVSSISARELRTIPTSSIQNALYGKLPGFFSQQRSGQPGKDASDFFIRGISSLNDAGNQPLIIVDDVQYSYDQLQQININEIESLSILKDASTTAIYGIKGANGVLIVKTRRGVEGKPIVTLRLESGMQTPVRTPDFLNSYESAILVNEAYENDGIKQLFNESDFTHFRDGTDPYGHPDVNWYDEIFKKAAFQSNANVDISGGSNRLRYFISGGYFSQNGLVKNFKDESNDVNTNYFYRRYNYRTNLDFDVTKTLNLRLDVTSRFMNINEPSELNATGEIYDFSKMHPYSAPVRNPDGSYAYIYDTDVKRPTLNARLANEGYKRTRRNDSNILFGATQKLDFITEGLLVSARLAYSSIDENYRRATRSEYPTYHYNSSTGTYNINPNEQYAYGNYSVTGDQEKSIKDVNLQANINYTRTFDRFHNVKLMLLYNRQSKTVDKDGLASANVPNNFAGYTATLGYNYNNKYLVDVNMAYNGTDRFGKDNRFGFFPAVGVGYVLSEEKFFKNTFPNIQLFKLRASFGIVGSDAAPGDRYLYRQVYNKGDGYVFGEADQILYGTYKEGALGNNNVTWEKARKYDVGLDISLLDKFSFTVDFFYDRRYDQLVKKDNLPLILGVDVAPTNIASTSNKGFDGQLNYQTRIGEVHFNTSLVFSVAKNKIIYKAEAEQRYDWLKETGRPIGQPFGYQHIGYYSPEDIVKIHNGDKSVAVPNSDVPVQAGDLKYKDFNLDGVINDFDKAAIGKPNLPNTTLGLSFGGYFKGLSLNILFQGSFNYSFSVIGTGIEPFKSQFQPVHKLRWTAERAAAGEPIEFPRLTRNPSTVNSASAYMSDFWLLDAWYIRLKTVDLSYQLPTRVLPKFISSAKVYVNAYNLFTLTNYDKYQQDPEIRTNSAGDSYMNQRVINIGAQLMF